VVGGGGGGGGAILVPRRFFAIRNEKSGRARQGTHIQTVRYGGNQCRIVSINTYEYILVCELLVCVPFTENKPKLVARIMTKKNSEIPPLDEVLDMSDWDPRMKEWYGNCNSLRILAVGRSGVGKSALINAMFGGKVRAPVAPKRDPTTMVVKSYTQMLGGVTLNIFDSPGLQDGKDSDDKYTLDMRETCKVVNLLLYCIRMDTQIHENDFKTIKLISRALGKGIWKHAICVLTIGNHVEPVDDESQGTPRDYFNSIFYAMKGKVQSHFKGELGIEIPVVVAGHPVRTQLPVCDDWRTKVLQKAIEKSSDEGAIAILKSNWGRYAAGSAAAASAAVGITGACLFLGPPGWVAAAGLMSAANLASIASNIGSIAQSRYENHQEKVEAVKKEMGGAARKK